MPISNGKILINQKEVGKSKNATEGLGIIIENPGFLPNYSGFINLQFLTQINKNATKDDIIKSIERVGLDPHNKKWVGKYSLGMKQRLGIAQAIVEKPDILLLDEPMNGLDKHGVNDIRKFLLELKNEGITIILSSHNSEDVHILCDNVYEMDDGILTSIEMVV